MDAATADVMAELQVVKSMLHDLTAILHRLAVPVQVLTTEQVAERLGRDVRTVHRLYAGGVFSDARPPGKRVKSSPRLTYADEVAAYTADGVNGVRRVQEQLGRPVARLRVAR